MICFVNTRKNGPGFNFAYSCSCRARKVHVPPRSRVGSQAANEGSHVARYGEVLQIVAGFPRGESRETGTTQDTGEGRQGHAFLY